jgi:3-carboxy-cis,cis-muconate cycloisomerase
LPSDELFASLFVPDSVREAVSGRAWLQAMLDAERAYAAAAAQAGVIPSDVAERIAAACDADRFDVAEIAVEGRRVANPAEPLVRALRKEVGGDDARYVHWGAASQDVVDTAAMLVARRALDLILGELDAVASECAALADRHRGTIVAARTLLQQAVPTTFGLKAAAWLVGVVEARAVLASVRRDRLAVQLGGAGGTLAALGERGPDVMRFLAEELELAEPVIPWHAVRGRVAELGAALDLAAGACAKIALDVTLLAQTEVAEVSTGDDGRSSTMPQKRNPASALLALACARHVRAEAGVLTASVVQEHERAVGAWQAEWEALSGAMAFAGGAATGTRATLEGLRVDEERMRSNLGEPALSERAAFMLAERVGLPEAQQAVSSGPSVREVLAEHLSPAEVDSALDPSGYLGSADVFVDRALELYRRELG